MPTNLLIPLGQKNPLYRHARGKWNWALLNMHYTQTGFQVGKGVGLLLIDLAVLDLDTIEEVHWWETEWPVLNNVPMETTSKGKHYFFMQTPVCDELGFNRWSTQQDSRLQVHHCDGHSRCDHVCEGDGKLCAIIVVCESYSKASKDFNSLHCCLGLRAEL